MYIKNNRVTIIGEITGNPVFSHEILGEGFYGMTLRTPRSSGTYDFVPVMISDRLICIQCLVPGNLVSISGQFRSYNQHEENRNRLILSVFVSEIDFVDEIEEGPESNQIYLDGYICKEPIYRKTPLGREISDLLLAVNRPYGKTDYIPCICWGRNARYASGLGVGAHVEIRGRVQSREYKKRISDTETETRIAYEVSVGKVEAGELTI